MRTCIIIVCAFIGLCACTEERAGYYIGEDAYVQFYYEGGYFFAGRLFFFVFVHLLSPFSIL